MRYTIIALVCWWKNLANRSTFAEVMGKNQLGVFSEDSIYIRNKFHNLITDRRNCVMDTPKRGGAAARRCWWSCGCWLDVSETRTRQSRRCYEPPARVGARRRRTLRSGTDWWKPSSSTDTESQTTYHRHTRAGKKLGFNEKLGF